MTIIIPAGYCNYLFRVNAFIRAVVNGTGLAMAGLVLSAIIN